MAQLVITPGDGTTSTREIESEHITLGRGMLNSVVMPAAPEGCKAEITLENGEYRFRNLGPYGTATLNYISVTQGALRDGDTLRFGKVECVFHAAAPVAEPMPEPAPGVEEVPPSAETLAEPYRTAGPNAPEPVFPPTPTVWEDTPELPVAEETPAHEVPAVYETPAHGEAPVFETPAHEPQSSEPVAAEIPSPEPKFLEPAAQEPPAPEPAAEPQIPSYEPEPPLPAAAVPPPVPSYAALPAGAAPPPIPSYSPAPPTPPAPAARPPSPPPVPTYSPAPLPVPTYSAAPPVPSSSQPPPPVPPAYQSAPPNYSPAPSGYPPAPSNYPPPPPANVTASLPPMPLPALASIAPLPTEAIEAAARVKPTSYFGKIAQVFRAAYREARRRTQLSTLDSRLRTARESEIPKAFYHVGLASYRAQIAPASFGPHYAQIADLEARLIAARQQVLANAQRGVAQGQAEATAYEGHLLNAFTALGAAVANGDRATLPAGILDVLLPLESTVDTLQKQHSILTADATSRAELSELLGELRHDTAEGLRHAGSSLSNIVGGGDEPSAEEAGFALPDYFPLKDRTTIGRDPRSDLVLPGVNISQNHLEIIRQGNEFIVRDLVSTLGTFLNGQRVTQPTPIREGDRLRVGKTTFALHGGALLPSSEKNNTRITVQSLTKTVVSLDTRQPLNLLDNVNLVIEPKEFVALLGPSGSGKSTFMDAINGRRRASSGTVMVNNDDFYESYQYYRRAIGYVPQQDIVHTSLTVRQALRFSAQMRLPADTTTGEVEGIITGVIKKLGLAERAHTRISNLSGGQLKRVSLGVELISDPSLLFLDEATSGLDAGTEGKMMTLFRKIADDGTTVVCITHNVENVYICNMVVLLVRGRLTYYGPPADMPGYFGVNKISDVYDVLEGQPAEAWAQRYEASELYRKFVVGRMPTRGVPTTNPGQSAAPPPIPGAPPPIPTSMPPPVPTITLPPRGGQSQTAELRAGRDPRQTGTNFLRQYNVLRQRYALITLQDRKNLLILLAQAPIIAVLIGLALWGKAKYSSTDPKADMEQVVLFLMVVSAVWFGCSNATKEIVKELPIYKRERAINLEILTYLLSKVTVLSMVCAIQCLLLVIIIPPLTGANISVVGSFVVIYLTALASTMMGLTVSSLVDNTDKANTITPLLLIPQVVFAGCIVPLDNAVMKGLASILIIAYWGFDGMVNLVPDRERTVHTAVGAVGVVKDPVFSSMVADLFFLVLMLVAFFFAAIWGLRRKDQA